MSTSTSLLPIVIVSPLSCFKDNESIHISIVAVVYIHILKIKISFINENNDLESFLA